MSMLKHKHDSSVAIAVCEGCGHDPHHGITCMVEVDDPLEFDDLPSLRVRQICGCTSTLAILRPFHLANSKPKAEAIIARPHWLWYAVAWLGLIGMFIYAVGGGR